MPIINTLKKRFRSYQGRHYLSRWARVWFRTTTHARRLIGLNLAAAVMTVGIVEPNAHEYIGRSQLANIPANPYVVEAKITTETTLAWPTNAPYITQGYRYGHPGIDMQDGVGLDIHPVDEGWVADILYSEWGYGNHIYVHHPYGRTSLYAHFNTIYVEKGQTVTRDTVLGTMGRTGWASGIHLHLEIYQDGIALNPLTVLPELTRLASK
jgi:murein DD-endopeptidase MepM/ murein hydrolase activator NlpD